MFRSSLITSSLIVLCACTQPAAVVELKGSQDFGQGRSYSMAAPVSASNSAAPRVGAQPVYNASRAQYDQQVANAPTQSTAPTSSIAVSDLAPAAGGETKTSNSMGTITTAPAEQKGNFLKLPDQKTATLSKPAATPAPATKEVALKKLDEPVAANAWTKKPRDEASFAGGKSQEQYIWPVTSQKVISSFGDKGKGTITDGMSIAVAEGEPVWASADGEIVYADSKMKNYGKMVIVKHNGGKTTTYAHLARYAVEKYDRVKQGDIIGYVGATGNVKSPQLYFSMRDGTQAVDPKKYIDRKVAGL